MATKNKELVDIFGYRDTKWHLNMALLVQNVWEILYVKVRFQLF